MHELEEAQRWTRDKKFHSALVDHLSRKTSLNDDDLYDLTIFNLKQRLRHKRGQGPKEKLVEDDDYHLTIEREFMSDEQFARFNNLVSDRRASIEATRKYIIEIHDSIGLTPKQLAMDVDVLVGHIMRMASESPIAKRVAKRCLKLYFGGPSKHKKNPEVAAMTRETDELMEEDDEDFPAF